jgi:hypothetical protein
VRTLAVWDYQASVARMRPLVARWKTVTAEMLDELYRARAELSRPGARTDLVPNGTRSWSGYLTEIGMARMTAHTWLSKYDPETHTIRELEPPAQPEPRPLPQATLDLEEERPARPGAVDPIPEEPTEPEMADTEEREEDEPAPAAGRRDTAPRRETPPDDALRMIKDYAEIVFEDLRTLSARHMVVNGLIKHFREISIRLNQEAM